jgi:hypothetical protein
MVVENAAQRFRKLREEVLLPMLVDENPPKPAQPDILNFLKEDPEAVIQGLSLSPPRPLCLLI